MPTPELPRALNRALEAEPLSTPGGAPRPGGRRVVVLGVGSELRSDDAAGVRRQLEKGEVVVLFDLVSQTVNLATAREA